MINKFKEIFSLLEKKQQKKIIYLQILMIITAFMEVSSLFAIAPFMSILVDYDLVNTKGYLADIYNYFEFQNPKVFYFFCFIIFRNFIYLKYHSYGNYMDSLYNKYKNGNHTRK